MANQHPSRSSRGHAKGGVHNNLVWGSGDGGRELKKLLSFSSSSPSLDGARQCVEPSRSSEHQRPLSGTIDKRKQAKNEYGRNDFESPEELEEFLRARGFDLRLWGKGTSKGAFELWNELQAKESVLFILRDTKQVVRRLRVVRVVVRRNPSDPFVLIEKQQVLRDGRIRHRGTVLAEKMKAGETPLQAARRGLMEELHGVVNVAGDIQSLTASPEIQADRKGSLSYPGLESFYDIHEVAAIVPHIPTSNFYTEEEGAHAGASTKRIYWSWHDTRLSDAPRGKNHHQVGVGNLHEFLSGSWSFVRSFVDNNNNNDNDNDNDIYSDNDGGNGGGGGGGVQVTRGTASFVEGVRGKDGDQENQGQNWLQYSEASVVTVNGLELNATRKYAYTFDKEKTSAVVRFLDGPSKDSVFHSLNLSSGKWDATHNCDPDVYNGQFRVLHASPSPPSSSSPSPASSQSPQTADQSRLSTSRSLNDAWEVTWNISGPKKDQKIKTVYTRCASTACASERVD